MFTTVSLVGTGASLPLSGWRLLLRCWLLLLAVVAVGGAVLEYLGPPPRSALQQPAQTPPVSPVGSEPRTAASPPMLAELPQPSRPLLEVQATGSPALQSLDQDNRTARARALVVLHLPRSDNGRAIAQQLAARAGLPIDQVATEVAADPPSRAIIRFYSPGDHPLARRLGRELAQMGYAWQIDNRSARAPASGQQVLEVWLPER